MKKTAYLFLAGLCLAAISCSDDAPQPYGPVPTKAQLEWQKMEMNLFVHFGPNTFTGKEWGDGTEPEDIFAPTGLDCRQWTEIASRSGFKGMIITAKHHDGFCLWPNPESVHTVAQCSWRDGKGDVLKELSEACREDGVKFGIYVSPWDRHDPHYGTLSYNDVFVRTLESALGNYGEVFEQWFDGACGEGPNGKRQVYDWLRFNETVGELQPEAVIFSDIGPGCRWVGNERGQAGETSWSTLAVDGFDHSEPLPSRESLNSGDCGGGYWVPSETDVSIRPGWFWRESENGKVKSVRELLDIYYTSVGRNSLLLLNVPPDTTGRFHPADSASLVGFKDALDRIFSVNLASDAKVIADKVRGRKYRPENLLDGDYDTFWACPDTCRSASFILELPEPRTFNRLLLQENIALGQRVTDFTVEALDGDGVWQPLAEGTTIGYKRILLFPQTLSRAVRVSLNGSLACPVLSEAGLYLDSI
ncbi:MAG: alpha-L-fucosidase [Candidatus Cryptobacteroides sp.]